LRWVSCSSSVAMNVITRQERLDGQEGRKTPLPIQAVPPFLPVLPSLPYFSILLLIPSSIPLMNFTDSSLLNVRASSMASLMTTGGGVSAL